MHIAFANANTTFEKDALSKKAWVSPRHSLMPSLIQFEKTANKMKAMLRCLPVIISFFNRRHTFVNECLYNGSFCVTEWYPEKRKENFLDTSKQQILFNHTFKQKREAEPQNKNPIYFLYNLRSLRFTAPALLSADFRAQPVSAENDIQAYQIYYVKWKEKTQESGYEKNPRQWH